MKFEANSNTWQAFAGANRLPDGREPEFAEVKVSGCPTAIDEECGWTAVLDSDEADVLVVTLNATTREGYPVTYRRAMPGISEAAIRSFMATAVVLETGAIPHDWLIAAGFAFDGVEGNETPKAVRDALIHGRFDRKPTKWSEVSGFDLVDGNENILRALPRFETTGDPMAEFDGPRPQFFVALVRGAFYLVNTEGADYARYAARLPKVLFAE